MSVLTKGVTQFNQLNEFLQVPKGGTTLKSFLKRKSKTQFRGPPLRPPQELENQHIKLLLGILTSESVSQVMKNHFFMIGGNLFRQKDGSPIGVDISVEIASLVMLRWDDKFLNKIKKLGLKIDLYKRYVDDILILMKEINPGWYFCQQEKAM